MLDNLVIIYKFIADVFFYVVAQADENEVVMSYVLHALTDSIQILLRDEVEKKTMLECLDLVLLTMDEIIDGGYLQMDKSGKRFVDGGYDGDAHLILHDDDTCRCIFCTA